MKASEFVCALRARISDTGKKLFPDDNLALDILNSALCNHQELRPELYSKYQIVPLEAGTVQKVSCCSQVLSVDSITNADGSIVVGLLRTVNQKAATLFSSRCGKRSPGGVTIPTSASIDPMFPRGFTVSPPVPNGAKIWARILCSSPPPTLSSLNDEVDLGCSNYEDAMLFVAGTMLATVPGSAEDRAIGAGYLDLYYKTNNLKRQTYGQIAARKV